MLFSWSDWGQNSTNSFHCYFSSNQKKKKSIDHWNCEISLENNQTEFPTRLSPMNKKQSSFLFNSAVLYFFLLEKPLDAIEQWSDSTSSRIHNRLVNVFQWNLSKPFVLFFLRSSWSRACIILSTFQSYPFIHLKSVWNEIVDINAIFANLSPTLRCIHGYCPDEFRWGTVHTWPILKQEKLFNSPNAFLHQISI